MSLGNYSYLIYIVLATGIVLLLHAVYCIWKRYAIRRFFSDPVRSSLVVGNSKIILLKEILIALGIVIAGLTLLRPEWGEISREVKSEGSDVLICLDVSNSMLAEDVAPNRLGRAKDAIKWIANSLSGDRIGLILFAGDSFLQCPLTNDIGAFLMFLDSAAPDSIQVQGTDIGGALEQARRVFREKRLTARMLILITDGEDHEGALPKAIDDFKDLDVSIYTVGIGKGEGDFIPAKNDEMTEDNYYRDSNGKLIRTKMDSSLLKGIAGKTGGSYIDISGDFSGLKSVIETIREQQKNQYGSRIVKEKKARFQIFALIVIVLLSLELVMPERRVKL